MITHKDPEIQFLINQIEQQRDLALSQSSALYKKVVDLTKKVEDLDCVVIQFPNEKLTNVFCCDVSPSFPFPVEISGCIKLK